MLDGMGLAIAGDLHDFDTPLTTEFSKSPVTIRSLGGLKTRRNKTVHTVSHRKDRNEDLGRKLVGEKRVWHKRASNPLSGLGIVGWNGDAKCDRTAVAGGHLRYTTCSCKCVEAGDPAVD